MKSRHALVEGKLIDLKGAVYRILKKAARLKAIGGDEKTAMMLLQMKIAIQTGLPIAEYGPDTIDNPEDIKRVLKVIRSPIIGLKDFEI